MLPFLPPSVPFRLNLLVAARLLPFFVKRASLADIIAMATPAAALSGSLSLSPSTIIAAVKRTTAHPWRMRGRRCLREGVLAFYYLSLAGHNPVLHFAVVPSSLMTAKPRAHCWISIQGETVLNPPNETMAELFRYDTTTLGPTVLADHMAWS